MKNVLSSLSLLLCSFLFLTQTTIQAQPDLTFTSFNIVSITPGSITHQSGTSPLRKFSINYTATVKNTGNTASNTCKLRPFLGEDLEFMTFVGCETFTALGAGATRNISGTINIVPTIFAVIVSLRLYIDAGDCQAEHFSIISLSANTVIETNENNNISTKKIIQINSDVLASYRKLTSGQSVLSPNGKYKLIFQADGNLVLYKVSGNVALWACRTDNQAAGGRCEMQADGNLVIYKPNGQAIWSTGTFGGSYTGSYLRVQDDANVVIYKTDGNPSWSTQTFMEQKTVDQLTSNQELQTQPSRKIFSNNRRYFLEFTGNGKLELRINKDKSILWQSNTNAPNGKCKIQPDGNFVIYNSANSSVWDSGTYDTCDSGSKIVLQDDGNLVIYRTNGGVAWTTETDGEKVNTNTNPARRLCQ